MTALTVTRVLLAGVLVDGSVCTGASKRDAGDLCQGGRRVWFVEEGTVRGKEGGIKKKRVEIKTIKFE